MSTDEMCHLYTIFQDDTGTPTYREVPVFSQEDDFNMPKIEEIEVTISEEDKDDHPISAKPTLLEKCSVRNATTSNVRQHYGATIAISTSPINIIKDGKLLSRSLINRSDKAVVPTTLRIAIICLSHTPLTQGHDEETNAYQE